MSALPPIATAKADSPKRSCLLYPPKRTCALQPGMSAMGQKRTSRHLFDHLVGAGEQLRGNGKAKGLRCPEVDDKVELGGLLYRQIGGFCTLQQLVHVIGGTPVQVSKVRAIGHQPAGRSVFAKTIHRR